MFIQVTDVHAMTMFIQGTNIHTMLMFVVVVVLVIFATPELFGLLPFYSETSGFIIYFVLGTNWPFILLAFFILSCKPPTPQPSRHNYEIGCFFDATVTI